MKCPPTTEFTIPVYLGGRIQGYPQGPNALRRLASEVLVFPTEAVPRYRRSRAGQPIAMSKYAEGLRADLVKAGVTRADLFTSEDGYPRL